MLKSILRMLFHPSCCAVRGLLAPVKTSYPAKLAWFGLVGFCLSIGLSIALAQVFVGLMLVGWLIASGNGVYKDSSLSIKISQPVVAWVLLCILSSFWGVDFGHALKESLLMALWVTVPFAVNWTLSSFEEEGIDGELVKINALLGLLTISLVLAALCTLLGVVSQGNVTLNTPGPVTQSGQLVLVIPLALAIFYNQAISGSETQNGLFPPRIQLFLMIVVCTWSDELFGASLGTFRSELLQILLGVFVFVRLGLLVRQSFKQDAEISRKAWQEVMLSILFAALVVNLKRGPWGAVFLELLVLGFFLSPRLIFWTIAGGIGLYFFLDPVQMRLLGYSADFSIQGGRENMWALGYELLQRYPLGLGFDNSWYMRELDPSLPYAHRHMHNNLLNQVVEIGWLGLFCFLWWMWSVLSLAYSSWRRLSQSSAIHVIQIRQLSLCLFLALLGWQVAGLVEYNLGDGEVRLIAFFLMGLVIRLGELAISVGFEERNTA